MKPFLIYGRLSRDSRWRIARWSGARIRWILNPRAGWVFAAFLAAAAHAAWWFALSPLPPAARPRHPAPASVAYGPAPSGGAEAGERAVWSASAFALPSPAGFSGPAATNHLGVRPPLVMADEAPRFGARDIPPPAPAAAGLGQDLAASVASALDRRTLRLQEERVFAAPAGAAGGSVQVDLAGGLAGRRFEQADLPDDPLIRGDKAWQAEASVETDEDGRVRHVFWETPPPSAELNLLLVRALSHWRLDEKGVWSGRVALRYAPSQIAFTVPRGGGGP